MDATELKAQVARLRSTFEYVLTAKRALLDHVGGNILVHVPGVLTWTIVTAGPGIGLYDGATDDTIAFAMVCEADVLAELFAAEGRLEVAPHLASGRLRVDGDIAVYQRFLALGRPVGNTFTVR